MRGYKASAWDSRRGVRVICFPTMVSSGEEGWSFWGFALEVKGGEVEAMVVGRVLDGAVVWPAYPDGE